MCNVLVDGGVEMLNIMHLHEEQSQEKSAWQLGWEGVWLQTEGGFLASSQQLPIDCKLPAKGAGIVCGTTGGC
jgi:hypothetical protein